MFQYLVPDMFSLLFPGACDCSVQGHSVPLVESKEAARGVLRTAGARGFMDYAQEIRSMLASQVEVAKRPREFAPASGGLVTTLAKAGRGAP